METMIAMVVIFGSLTALAYTATVGFRYISYGRDRQQATAYANKIMEEIRGQAYSVITRGMSTSDLTGDPKIVSCTSPTATRFESCSGPKIVSTTVSGGTTAPWIIPHKSSTAVTVGHLKLNWATYVTNDNTASNPYTVTVIVTWGNGAIANGPNNIVRLQSQFWSPSGCVSSSTHPFAAPCQPFYYGLAQVPEGSISFSGQLHDSFVDWEKGALTFPEARALSQQEQIISTTADATESRIEMQDSAGLEEGGGTTAQSVADTDPGFVHGVECGGLARPASAMRSSVSRPTRRGRSGCSSRSLRANSGTRTSRPLPSRPTRMRVRLAARGRTIRSCARAPRSSRSTR